MLVRTSVTTMSTEVRSVVAHAVTRATADHVRFLVRYDTRAYTAVGLRAHSHRLVHQDQPTHTLRRNGQQSGVNPAIRRHPRTPLRSAHTAGSYLRSYSTPPTTNDHATRNSWQPSPGDTVTRVHR